MAYIAVPKSKAITVQTEIENILKQVNKILNIAKFGKPCMETIMLCNRIKCVFITIISREMRHDVLVTFAAKGYMMQNAVGEFHAFSLKSYSISVVLFIQKSVGRKLEKEIHVLSPSSCYFTDDISTFV